MPLFKKISISCNERKNTLQIMSNTAAVSNVGTATVVISQRDCQIITLVGVGKKLSQRAICYAYPL
ncbi:MAG TPA: hypothetical protein ACFYD4_09675 [Candidatus Wunengus sp. YC61]|uniref:hypothetical protein n=1 Tax=Candidatus Wunengus sp. YC61 TaxID=3367698 RepID=UPI0040273E01